MPEYLSPGVYIEEVSYRSRNIEGVSTSTAGFVGAARFGPVEGKALLVTSFAEFERYFGSLHQLVFKPPSGSALVTQHNYLAHAVRAFFDEGGSRLYISRIFKGEDIDTATDSQAVQDEKNGFATVTIAPPTGVASGELGIKARYPGSGGNVQLVFTAKLGQNLLRQIPVDPGTPTGAQQTILVGVNNGDMVLIKDTATTTPDPVALTPYLATYNDSTQVWTFTDIAAATWGGTLDNEIEVYKLTFTVDAIYPGSGDRRSWEGLSLRDEDRLSLNKVFAEQLGSIEEEALVPVIIEHTLNSLQLAYVLFGQSRTENELPRLLRILVDSFDLSSATPTEIAEKQAELSVLLTLDRDELSESDHEYAVTLTNGNDGLRPEAGEYEGDGDPNLKTGLTKFEDVADISIVAAPGATYNYATAPYTANADQIIRHLIAHCERMRYRIAVLEAGDNQSLSTIRKLRSTIDSKHAALYYPWIQILDPVTRQKIFVPPAGNVAGIYARNDIQRGVHKAPANEVVRQAIGLEVWLNKAQQDVLNPEGINCFRYFEGRGFRLWGARTVSSDSEWVYVNLRRFFAYLERSIERGTQWVVFEPNNERLWADVRRTIEDFLYAEWKANRLMGTSPQEAYFVKCDRSTMTQNDIDSGRLICLVGVAAIRPAEFVIFRIGQWTADATS